jgi:hypothetical protein
MIISSLGRRTDLIFAKFSASVIDKVPFWDKLSINHIWPNLSHLILLSRRSTLWLRLKGPHTLLIWHRP